MLEIYNALTKKKEKFHSIHPGKINMYVCGPTVYDHCHLGHGRGYVSMDIIRKYLEYLGYEVRFIMNYTDVGHLVNDAEQGEDKIQKKAQAEKIDPLAVVQKYIQSCQEDFTALNIKPATFNPRPTSYIAQIIKFIEELIIKGIAYEVNGSVYFSVEKFPEYGKLSGRKTKDLVAGSRIDINSEKTNPLDFALWIKASQGHILKWDSPWSLGYPGWHIECSVMSCDLLGQDTFDIHGGGNENIFPHNENEIAQSEAYLEKKMANYWTLWNMVNVNGVKMSKSLGNFTTIKDSLKKYDPAVIRLWILSSQYRNPINYTSKSLEQAQSNLNRLKKWLENLAAKRENNQSDDIKESFSLIMENYQEKFQKAMDDDFNTPLALAIVYKLITVTNKSLTEGKLKKTQVEAILSFWEKINKVLGLKINYISTSLSLKNNLFPSAIIDLAEQRKKFKKNKKFTKADKIREEIIKAGYKIKDTQNDNYLLSK